MNPCYACMVGVSTGPESHSPNCSHRNHSSTGIRHEIRWGKVHGRDSWECSCGNSGSVGEFGDVDAAADRHINFDRGDTRIYSSKSFDDVWS